MEWYDKILKYSNKITAAIASNDELGDYIAIKVYIYTQEDFIDYTLWIIFKEEFKGFTTKDFKHMQINIKVKIHTHLLKRGVYVGRYNNRYLILKALFNLFQEEEPYK